MEPKQNDWAGIIIMSLLAILLAYAGLLSYQSIDWGVLNRLESTPLLIPTQFVPIKTPPSTEDVSITPIQTPPPQN